MRLKYKVLIVNDNEQMASTLEGLLRQEGYTVETAPSADNAFGKVECCKYHIILINSDLPDMDGIELLKRMKKYDPMSQIIMMTEHPNIGDILSSLEYGANDYLNMSLKSAELVIEVVNDSVHNLERWRETIVQLVK
ncbi:response regulator [Paenibacillus sp. sgz500958]|uniref:response regulator n=1 Tax=Paenibacillus sp. sgz500958 TaxID=3242475 RepID=UPI0036D40D3C